MQQGERMGLIRFGSRVDVFLPVERRAARESRRRHVRRRHRARGAGRPMNALQRGPRPPKDRQGVRRAVVLMPNGFTLFNLFCGIYAIILAIAADVLGGAGVHRARRHRRRARRARRARDGNRQPVRRGARLARRRDLVRLRAGADHVPRRAEAHGTWEWLLVFIFTACAVMRLARFNVEQAGRKKTHFHGLAESGRRPDARDVLLVQPDAALQPDGHSLHRQQNAVRPALARDPSRADGRSRRADDQRRAVSRGPVDRVQLDSTHRRDARSIAGCRRAAPRAARRVHLPRAARLRAVRRREVGHPRPSWPIEHAGRDLWHDRRLGGRASSPTRRAPSGRCACHPRDSPAGRRSSARGTRA